MIANPALRLLGLLLVVAAGTVSAFQVRLVTPKIPTRIRPSSLLQAVSIDSSNSRSNNNNDQGELHSVILQGKSPKAVRLRQQLQELWSNPNSNATSSILVMGPKGGGKPSIVDELLEKLPPTTVHRIALDDAVDFMDTVLGTATEPGTLDLLADQTNTTLVIKGFDSPTASSEDNFGRHKLLEDVAIKLLLEQSYFSQKDGMEKPFQPRIIYSLHTSGIQDPDFVKQSRNTDKQLQIVKVPGLETRTQDMASIASAKIKLLEKEFGLSNRVLLTPEANHRLLDHTWAEGEPELDQELRNAMLRLTLDQQKNPYLFEGPLPWLLEPKHMLVQAPEENMRHRLLYEFPILRKIINSPWIFDHTQRYIVTPVFIAFLALLFWGPQTREHSAALTVFWAGWWPLVMLSFPLLGRIWCSICPFMAVGNVAQEAVTAMGVELKKWPKWVETVGPPFAFGLFFAILVWEELWHLPQDGALSAWLLLLITSGAVFNSVQFENRMWCRYLCPIGAMCRVFGTMSMTEVRSFKANCQGCTNPQCVNGDSPVPDPSDTFALRGCTMGLKNNQLRDMGHCTMCMSCVKNCDKEVPEVNTRPIGIDFGLPYLLPPGLQDPKNMAISQVETNFYMGALITILQGSVLLHYMPRMLYNIGVDPTITTAAPSFDISFYAYAAATIMILALPGLLSLLVDTAAVPIENALVSLQDVWGEPTEEKVHERSIIIETYELLLKSDKSLEGTLQELDPDGDSKISCWEFQRALRHLDLPEQECKTLMGSIRRRMGREWIDSVPIEEFLDTFQQVYVEAKGNNRSLPKRLPLETKKTFVELFTELDKDGDGFIMPGDFDNLLDRDFKLKRTWEEKRELFRSADVIGQGRLNLFEFMTMMRKIAQAGIQEIGYGYLPLAWASLTAYWAGLGLKELGLTLVRLPDTFYLDSFFSSVDLPSLVASDRTVELVQAFLIIGALPISVGLTQKLCNDNKVGGVRFGLHAGVQVVGALTTLYLMLSSNPLMLE